MLTYQSQQDCDNWGNLNPKKLEIVPILRLDLYRCIVLQPKGKVDQIFQIV